jgi:hypothetical protein
MGARTGSLQTQACQPTRRPFSETASIASCIPPESPPAQARRVLNDRPVGTPHPAGLSHPKPLRRVPTTPQSHWPVVVPTVNVVQANPYAPATRSRRRRSKSPRGGCSEWQSDAATFMAMRMPRRQTVLIRVAGGYEDMSCRQKIANQGWRDELGANVRLGERIPIHGFAWHRAEHGFLCKSPPADDDFCERYARSSLMLGASFRDDHSGSDANRARLFLPNKYSVVCAIRPTQLSASAHEPTTRFGRAAFVVCRRPCLRVDTLPP